MRKLSGRCGCYSNREQNPVSLPGHRACSSLDAPHSGHMLYGRMNREIEVGGLLKLKPLTNAVDGPRLVRASSLEEVPSFPGLSLESAEEGAILLAPRTCLNGQGSLPC